MIGSPLQIREARAGDAPALAPLLEELGYPTAVDVIARRLQAMIEAGEVAFVASRDDELLGLLTVHVTPVLQRPTAVGRLTALVVAQRAHGQGIGRALVEAGEKFLAGRGCMLLEVTSNRARTGAHAFYERLGYEITSFRLKKSLEP